MRYNLIPKHHKKTKKKLSTTTLVSSVGFPGVVRRYFIFNSIGDSSNRGQWIVELDSSCVTMQPLNCSHSLSLYLPVSVFLSLSLCLCLAVCLCISFSLGLCLSVSLFVYFSLSTILSTVRQCERQ